MNDGNFYEILRRHFSPRMDAPMLSTPGGATITYREMDAQSAKMARAMADAGAKPGDRVLVQVDKSFANVAAYLGAMRGGFVYVPANTAYTDDEVAYFLSDAEPTLAIFSPARAPSLANHARRTGVKTILTLDGNNAGSLVEAANAALADDAIHPRHPEDLAAILYTSGTTGRSKGAMLSHRALRTNALALNSLWNFSSADVLLHALPIFHIHGLFVALHTAMLSGSEILFLPKFDVGDVLNALPRASVMMGVPTFFARMLADPRFTMNASAHMRLFISGSAPLTAELFRAFEARTGKKILERYGMSEAGMIASNPLDGARVAGTVGFPVSGVDMRITDDKGATTTPDVSGNVEIKGDSLFSGYWRMPEKTAAEFRGDWFATGDVGSLDADGRLTLSGRAKDLIIAGGLNIYPTEIESVLDAVPSVAESAVIGVPHPDMGEGVVAVLVAKPDARRKEDTLTEALDGLAKFKRPRKFYWIETLPRNAMGKVQKQILREQFSTAFTGAE